jgi:hypothetical protein
MMLLASISGPCGHGGMIATPSLGRAIEEWVDMLSTPDEEIAEFIGWPVEKIREYR